MSPALADLPVRKVTRVLEQFDFEHIRTKGSHAIHRHSDGRTAIVPMHGTDKHGTLASMSRQTGSTSG